VQEVLDAVADFSLHDLSDQFAPDSQRPLHRPPPVRDAATVERELLPALESKPRAVPKTADFADERSGYARLVLREVNGNSRYARLGGRTF
jgi:hypothetical protein